MEKKKKILELRERLDKTLCSPELANEESLKSLVKSQLLRSSFSEYEGDFANILQKRVAEVSNFLEMLRSASGNDRDSLKAHGTSHNDWKLKQDTDQLRVMYREGLQGTPFHTLLTEGYADGPIDVCLCVSWESTLYKKWWPQYNIPSFKIIMSRCLQKVRVGEEISLVRVKVPWPVSDREAVLHCFELEYHKEDLILVLLNTIPHTEDISVSTHGFTKDGIPEAKDTVRIDLVGGFVLQKVGPNRSYFRAIATMDIKLDFVPPSLINFISRQLIGNGHKLYQKAIASVATSDNDYQQVLKGPMYVRVREGLNHLNKSKASLEDMVKEKSMVHLIEESTVEIAPINVPIGDNTSVATSCIQESTVNTSQIGSPISDKTLVNEIEEEEIGQNLYLEGNQPSTSLISDHRHYNKDRVFISPEVEHALDILDQAIAMFHHHGSPSSKEMKYSSDQELQISEKVEQSTHLNGRDAPLKANMDNKPSHEVKGHPIVEHFRHSDADPVPGESEHEEQASFLRGVSKSGNTKTEKLSSSHHLDGTFKTTVSVIPPPKLDQISKVFDEKSGSGVDSNQKKKKRRQRLCCLSFVQG